MTAPAMWSCGRCSYLTMRRACNALERAFERALAPTALSAAQFLILRSLSACDSISSARLASLVDCVPSALSDDVHALAQQGLVELHSSPATPKIRLTPTGRSRLDAAIPVWNEVQRRVDLLFGHPEANDLYFALEDITLVICDAESNIDIDDRQNI